MHLLACAVIYTLRKKDESKENNNLSFSRHEPKIKGIYNASYLELFAIPNGPVHRTALQTKLFFYLE